MYSMNALSVSKFSLKYKSSTPGSEKKDNGPDCSPFAANDCNPSHKSLYLLKAFPWWTAISLLMPLLCVYCTFLGVCEQICVRFHGFIWTWFWQIVFPRKKSPRVLFGLSLLRLLAITTFIIKWLHGNSPNTYNLEKGRFEIRGLWGASSTLLHNVCVTWHMRIISSGFIWTQNSLYS